jgi:hypothetical protein
MSEFISGFYSGRYAGWTDPQPCAGVLDEGDKRRFGWHNFRHSLASFLIAGGADARLCRSY